MIQYKMENVNRFTVCTKRSITVLQIPNPVDLIYISLCQNIILMSLFQGISLPSLQIHKNFFDTSINLVKVLVMLLLILCMFRWYKNKLCCQRVIRTLFFPLLIFYVLEVTSQAASHRKLGNYAAMLNISKSATSFSFPCFHGNILILLHSMSFFKLNEA